MEDLEQENQGLREEVTSMKAEIEKLTAMMTDILAAQARVSIPQLPGIPVIQPTSTVFVSTPQLIRPEGCPWGMPHPVFNEGFRPGFSEAQNFSTPQAAPVSQPGLSLPQATMVYSAPLVHTIQQD
ncbi:hypothetical protein A2U01_0044706, partial [Trifolium medium]|nr:hypothetical protein [Trifolium medium]